MSAKIGRETTTLLSTRNEKCVRHCIGWDDIWLLEYCHVNRVPHFQCTIFYLRSISCFIPAPIGLPLNSALTRTYWSSGGAAGRNSLLQPQHFHTFTQTLRAFSFLFLFLFFSFVHHFEFSPSVRVTRFYVTSVFQPHQVLVLRRRSWIIQNSEWCAQALLPFFLFFNFFFYLQDFHSHYLQHFNLYLQIYLRHTYTYTNNILFPKHFYYGTVTLINI